MKQIPEELFKQLLKGYKKPQDLLGSDGLLASPQDVRPTFTTGRLHFWYREGIDVQVHLPWLATYPGHAGLSGTQAYLTMTPDLLAEASVRFQRLAETLAQGDAS